MTDAAVEVLTIGHSTLSLERFLALLRQASVTAIADVRSSPFSKLYPHFNRNGLRAELRKNDIAYVFLGNELGGRPKDKKLFFNGVADYEKMAASKDFLKGLDRVIDGAKKYRIAMMCSEHDPLDCHRCLLVGRALHEQGLAVGHILNADYILSQGQIENKLLEISGKSKTDLFDPPDKRIAAAYKDRAMKVAFSERKDNPPKALAVE